jgi:hypothetical protein
MSAFFCFLLIIAPGLFSRATGFFTTPRDSKRSQKPFTKFEQKQRKESFESKVGSKKIKIKKFRKIAKFEKNLKREKSFKK